MPESSISFTKNFAVFRDEKELVAGIGRILTKGIGLQKPAAILREMAREVRAPSDKRTGEHVSLREFGNYYLTLAQYEGGLVPLLASEIEGAEEVEGPDVKARRLMRQIRQSERAERLTTSGNVTVRVQNPREAATVLDAVLAAVPVRREVEMSDVYINPEPLKYYAFDVEGKYEEHEIPAYPMFQLRRGGDTHEYAQAIMNEGRRSPYITDGGLTVYLGGYPAEGDGDEGGYNLDITLMKLPNPLMRLPRPFTNEDQQTAEALLGGLQQQLQTL